LTAIGEGTPSQKEKPSGVFDAFSPNEICLLLSQADEAPIKAHEFEGTPIGPAEAQSAGIPVPDAGREDTTLAEVVRVAGTRCISASGFESK